MTPYFKKFLHVLLFCINSALTCLLIETVLKAHFRPSEQTLAVTTVVLLVNGAWLIWVLGWFRETLRLLTDKVDRLELEVPTILGIISSLVDVAIGYPIERLLAALLLVAWASVLFFGLRKRLTLKRVGDGLSEKEIILNPTLEQIENAGDRCVLLTQARNISRLLKDSFGHMEKVVRSKDQANGNGLLYSVTSFLRGPGFDGGMVKQRLSERFRQLTEENPEPFAVVIYRKPLTDEQSNLLWDASEVMLARNRAWTQRRQANREKIINIVRRLPFSGRLSDWLLKNWRASGYNYWCLVTSITTRDGWDCVTTAVELMNRASMDVDVYPRVLPMIPQDIFGDPNFATLTHGVAEKLREDNRVSL